MKLVKFYLCNVFFVLEIFLKDSFQYVFKLKLLQDISRVNSWFEEGEQFRNPILYLPNETRLQLCDEALSKIPLCQNQGFVSTGELPEVAGNYEITFKGLSQHETLTRNVSAYKCATRPPIYLRCGHSDEEIVVMIVERTVPSIAAQYRELEDSLCCTIMR